MPAPESGSATRRDDVVIEAARELGAEAVPPDEIYDLDVDVFAPCAMGGILDDATIPRLRAAVVAGSADNQLAEGRHAHLLLEQGVLYAPDYVINTGALIAASRARPGAGPEEVESPHHRHRPLAQRSARPRIPGGCLSCAGRPIGWCASVCRSRPGSAQRHELANSPVSSPSEGRGRLPDSQGRRQPEHGQVPPHRRRRGLVFELTARRYELIGLSPSYTLKGPLAVRNRGSRGPPPWKSVGPTMQRERITWTIVHRRAAIRRSSSLTTIPPLRDAVRMCLEAAGMAVESFVSAETFLDRHCADRHGCLVLDVRMTGASGLELHRELADRELSLPTVFITGHGDVSMSVEAMKAGAVDFLEKAVRSGSATQRRQRGAEEGAPVTAVARATAHCAKAL